MAPFVLCCDVAKRRTMERSEAITKLKQHEAELKRLGVEHLYCSVRLRVAKPETIPMSICSSIIPKALLGSSR